MKKIELNDGRLLYCAWISRDPEEEGEGGRSMSSFALASSFNSTSPLDHSVRSIAEVSVDILAMFFFFFFTVFRLPWYILFQGWVKITQG